MFLLYEGNPIAFLAEQAGGIASDGYNRILDIQPTELHQRVPLFIGSAEMVKKAEEMIAKGGLTDQEYKMASAKLQRALVRLSVKE